MIDACAKGDVEAEGADCAKGEVELDGVGPFPKKLPPVDTTASLLDVDGAKGDTRGELDVESNAGEGRGVLEDPKVDDFTNKLPPGFVDG
jgi:hypothetical protein|mmetsp:Transcript_13924/g.13454  ORF Transcript_13924/g.13454 Transcript_13924/m.13454 type:complete len:90 (-) Transcript_13924:511-780(-)